MKGDDLIRLDDYEHVLIAIAHEIVSYLEKSGVPKAEAEDVVQDVFVKMLEANWVIPEEKVRSWMYRVAIRRFIDRYRRNQHFQELLREQLYELESEKEVKAGKGRDLLEEVMEALPQKDQTLLNLYYFQGFSVKEIAEILGDGQSKVKVGLMRARKKIRKEMKEKGWKYGNI